MVGLTLEGRVLADILAAVHVVSMEHVFCHETKLTFNNITHEETKLFLARRGGVNVCFHALLV